MSDCYICNPETHLYHDDPDCDGCDQGCAECFADWVLFAEGPPQPEHETILRQDPGE